MVEYLSKNNLPATGRGASAVTVGVVTAFAAESAAMQMVIDDLDDQPAPGDINHYRSGWLPSKDPHRPHRVVVAAQTRDGTRDAASLCTDMVRSFPQLRVFIMCGVAGGIPRPGDSGRDVRLGDVVVSTKGVVDYGHVRSVNGVDTLRRPVQGLSAALSGADRELERRGLVGDEEWRALLESLARETAGWHRPDADRDPLHRRRRAANVLNSPRDMSAGRQSWVFRGLIGSADRLLRDVKVRDELAARHDVMAVEMEAAGMAASATAHDRHWFMVRGIVDYCDDRTKNDVWHRYSALAASAYVRALLAQCAPFPSACDPAVCTRTSGADRINAIVEALLGLPMMLDDQQRRAVLAALPARIRAAVPENDVPRLRLLRLVQTCEQYPDGLAALLAALRAGLGDESPHLRGTEDVIRRNWSTSSSS